jgi:protocatechuate 3,4-dioxygenase alpha subunit
MMIGTGSQTVGPFFHVGLCTLFSDTLVDARFAGPLITVRGRVIDGDGAGVADAMLEIWQATREGNTRPSERHDGFYGFGRVPTGADGSFQFTTTMPGRVAGPDGKPQAPHIVVAIFMRGLLRHLNSRIYFADGPAIQTIWCCASVEPGRRDTLVAREVCAGYLRMGRAPAGRVRKPCSSISDGRRLAASRSAVSGALLPARSSQYARLQGMLDFEAALARAGAKAGLIPPRAARRHC